MHEKILIVRLSSIGDIVLASPLVRALRSQFPTSEIDFLVKSEYADLVRFNHHLSSVIEFGGGGIRELRGLKKLIREKRYDVVLDLHNSLRSRYLRLFSGARRTHVIRKRALARLVLVTFKRNIYRGVVPVAERYMETATSLGVRDDGKGLELFIPDAVAFSVSSMMSTLRLDRHDAVLGLVPGARHNTKMWPVERYAEVGIEAVRHRHAKVLLFGGGDDRARCDQIAAALEAGGRAGAVANLAGKLSLLETAAALDFCDAVVCNDTGIMHLAAARQRNVIALFGPTVAEFGFFPWGTRAIVLEQKGLYCRPCTHIGSAVCPENHFRCMRDTSAERVIGAVAELIPHTIPTDRS